MSTGTAFAETTGGLLLQITPGTDTLLHLGISRYILENNWQDQAFIDEWLATSWEIGAGMGRGTRNTPWQWRTTWGQFGTDFGGYKDWIMKNDISTKHLSVIDDQFTAQAFITTDLDDNQITICDLTGTGAQDTAIATYARKVALAERAGTIIET